MFFKAILYLVSWEMKETYAMLREAIASTSFKTPSYRRQAFNAKVDDVLKKSTTQSMPKEEALKILELSEPYTPEEVEARYEQLFNINDPTKGGSFYLQCKFIGAKETLLAEAQ